MYMHSYDHDNVTYNVYWHVVQHNIMLDNIIIMGNFYIA